MTDTAQLYGDWVAVGYGTSPSFYRYQDRNLGINLGNTEAPVYEWALIGAPGTEGQAVAAGTPRPDLEHPRNVPDPLRPHRRRRSGLAGQQDLG